MTYHHDFKTKIHTRSKGLCGKILLFILELYKDFRISVISIQSKNIEDWDTQGKHLEVTQTEVELGKSQTYLFMFLF